MKQKYLTLVDSVNEVRKELEEQRDVIRNSGYDVRELYRLVRIELNHLCSKEEERQRGIEE